jgi:hypothetical protein
MIRVRLPGGVCTPEQWLHMDAISDEHGNSTFKLTTRQVSLSSLCSRLCTDYQTFQFHGIIKKHLKPAMQAINRSCLDSIAACGDVSKWILLPSRYSTNGQTETFNVPSTHRSRLSTRRSTSSPRVYPSISFPAPPPTTRSGSTKRRSEVTLSRTLSLFTVLPTFPESSRLPSLSHQTTRSTS